MVHDKGSGTASLCYSLPLALFGSSPNPFPFIWPPRLLVELLEFLGKVRGHLIPVELAALTRQRRHLEESLHFNHCSKGCPAAKATAADQAPKARY